jgi:O-antigen ligase
MVSKWLTKLSSIEQPKLLFGVYASIVILSLFIGIATEFYYLAALPIFILLVYLTIVDFQKVFYLLLFFIPLSTEFYFPNGFGTDLPTEPLMVGLMLTGFLFLLRHGHEVDGRFLKHPLTLILLFHVSWIGFTAITSSMVLISVKFLLAKIWYIATFYFLASRILKGEKDVKQYFWIVFIPLFFTVVQAIVRHSAYGFSFSDVYKVLSPFYRNHVAYAAIIVLFTPFVWFIRQWYPTYSRIWWILSACLIVMLIAIQLSYTRAAYVSVAIAAGAYFFIRLRLTRYVLILALIGIISGLAFLSQNNRYLGLAPDYETTTSHQSFDNLLEATYQMEDISTMERLYRWVAGFQMTSEHPFIGFGPGNFYTFYKSYTVTSFQTYVSDNPEKSGVHSYYLMTLVEQGIPGLVLFLIFCAYILLHGEALYHQLALEKEKQIVMMALLSQIIIMALLLINDLIETDKVGPFFFMNIVLLVSMDLYGKKIATTDGTVDSKTK